MYIGKLVGSAIQTVFFDNKCVGGCRYKLQMAALTLTNFRRDISMGSTVETVTITPAQQQA